MKLIAVIENVQEIEYSDSLHQSIIEKLSSINKSIDYGLLKCQKKISFDWFDVKIQKKIQTKHFRCVPWFFVWNDHPYLSATFLNAIRLSLCPPVRLCLYDQ